MHLIKKYQNRKLYSTISKKYINLEDLIKLIKQNEQIKVVHYKSQEDLTKDVLTQALKHVNMNTEDLITLIRNW